MRRYSLLCILVALVFALSACPPAEPAPPVEPPIEEPPIEEPPIEEPPIEEEPPVEPEIVLAHEGIVPGTEILGASVRDLIDSSIGSVDDYLISVQNGEVPYLVMSFGGFLGFGETLYAIPTRLFTAEIDEELRVSFILDVDEELLERAPTLEWPDVEAPGWDSEVQGFWDAERPPLRPEEPQEETDVVDPTPTPEAIEEDEENNESNEQDVNDDEEVEEVEEVEEIEEEEIEEVEEVEVPVDMTLIRATDALGASVRNLEDESLGSLDDFMVFMGTEPIEEPEPLEVIEEEDEAIEEEEEAIEEDEDVVEEDIIEEEDVEEPVAPVENGEFKTRVAFALLSYGGVLGIGASYLPVPWEEFTWDPVDEVFLLQLTVEALEEAPEFDWDEDWPDIADPGWEERMRGFWETLRAF